jgi:glycyl-tRNA synthetase
MPGDVAFMEKLTSLCKRRGFIYQSSEIYGGIGGFWDYGPLGVELKRNIKEAWWHDMVTNPPIGPDGREVEMVGLDCAIIMNPRVWEASGHVAGFSDLMSTCRACKKLVRADQLDAMLEESEWYQSLGELCARGPVGAAQLRRWAETRGRKLAPNLGIVREPGLAAGRLEGREPARSVRELLEAIRGTQDSGPKGLLPCPYCGGELTEPRPFNLMFKTTVGAVEDPANTAYLRPETAQGIFVNFKNVLDTTRVKLPFGIAQIGKAFRNEINPRNYTFRSREFEQMEIEFFCHPEQSMAWYEFWRKVRYDWYVGLGLRSEKLRLRDQGPQELAHYSRACADIEYLFPFSDEFQELEGVAHRGNFDLTQHARASGKDLTYFDDEAWERDKDKFPPEQHKEIKNREPYRFLPTVIEPSAGVDRSALAFLCEAYCEDQAPDENGVMQPRVVLKLHPRLAPIKVAVFPLVKREGMPEVAEAIFRDLRRHMPAFYDEKGAIGRRYRRQDEAGTPYCVTVDGQTLVDGTVTIRDRDTLQQIRIDKAHVLSWLREKLGN